MFYALKICAILLKREEMQHTEDGLVPLSNEVVLDPQARFRVLQQTADEFLSQSLHGLSFPQLIQTAAMLLKQARVYDGERLLEPAYIYYSRYLSLWVDFVVKHSEFWTLTVEEKKNRKQSTEDAFNAATRIQEQLIGGYIREAEELKCRLNAERAEKAAAFGHGEKPRKEADRIQAAGAQLENGESQSTPKPYVLDACQKLRTLFIPYGLTDKFLELAKRNTANNVETCGILCGKLSFNELHVTHLIMPKQHGTSDRCTTEREEELVELCHQHNLICLGWIHTHPSQTAFLSSVDLHMSFGYQMSLRESIAIVCSVKSDEIKYFRLTDAGLAQMAICKGKGFHEHSQASSLYMTCKHYELVGATGFEVIDIRQT